MGIDGLAEHQEVRLSRNQADARGVEQHETLVDDTALPEDGRPRVDAEEVARPEGHDHEDQEGPLPALRQRQQEVCERIRENETDGGYHRRDEHGPEQHLEIDPVAQEEDVVGERELASELEFPGPQDTHRRHDQHGEHEQDRSRAVMGKSARRGPDTRRRRATPPSVSTRVTTASELMLMY